MSKRKEKKENTTFPLTPEKNLELQNAAYRYIKSALGNDLSDCPTEDEVLLCGHHLGFAFSYIIATANMKNPDRALCEKLESAFRAGVSNGIVCGLASYKNDKAKVDALLGGLAWMMDKKEPEGGA